MKLKWVVAMLVISMLFGVICMGYCKTREAQINKKLQDAIARSHQTRPIYYPKGE